MGDLYYYFVTATVLVIPIGTVGFINGYWLASATYLMLTGIETNAFPFF